MSEYKIQDTTLTGIADAIRSKEGSTASIAVSDFASRIEAIETGLEEGSFAVAELTAAMPSSASFQSVAYGNGTYVAVRSGANSCYYSSDGVSWTAATMPSSVNWVAVAYGGGKFVAIASGTDVAAYSTDGVSWTATTMVQSVDWRAVAYGNGAFVAVAYGESTFIEASSDGITWTKPQNTMGSIFASVAYGNGEFVIPVLDFTLCTIFSADSGFSNVVVQTVEGFSSSPYVAYGDGTFVLVGSGSNLAAYSTDPTDAWTATTLPASADWSSVTYGNGCFVALASGSATGAFSTDGANWVEITLPSSANWKSVTHGDNKFVAVAEGSSVVAISYDGYNWYTSFTGIADSEGNDVTGEVLAKLGRRKGYITFSLFESVCVAEEGMTLKAWCASEHNTIGATCTTADIGDIIALGDEGEWSSYYLSDGSPIESGASYETI